MLLVTGGLGYLGRHLVADILASTDEKIRLLVRPGTSDAVLAQHGWDERRIELSRASFNRIDDLKKACEGIDVIYHVAASLKGSYAAQVANTVIGTENLFIAADGTKVRRIVLVSSFSVMGVTKKHLVDESVPLEPNPQLRDPYAFAKLRQEELAWMYIRDRKLPVVIVRPGVIYGPGTPILTSRIGLSMFGMFLHLGGNNQVPLTHVQNCADAVLLAGQVQNIEGEVFNVCDDDPPTAKEILREYRRTVEHMRTVHIPYWVLRFIGKLNEAYTRRTKGHLPLVFRPYLVDCVWKSRTFTNRKAKEVLGWKPRIAVPDGIRSTLDAVRMQKAKTLAEC